MRKFFLLLVVFAIPQILSAQEKKPRPVAKKPVPAKATPEPAENKPPAQPATTAPAAPEAAAESAKPAENTPQVKHYVSEELMESLKNKRMLNDHDFEKKKVGGYITGLPLINSDPNTGIGYGARIYLFNNGEKEDPLFRRTPYRQRLYGQFFQTTNGYQYHELNFDSPYIANTLYRVRSALVFEKNTWANFYGLGGRTMNALGNGLTNGVGTTSYDKYSDYYSDINKIDNTTGTTNAAFTKYSYTRPALVATLERDLFGGIVRPQLGIQVGKYTIQNLDGTQVKTDSGNNATSNATLLSQYCQAQGQIQGCGGGWNNTVRFGIAIDLRDFEPDPNKGMLFEVIAEVSNKAYGSEFNYARYTVSEKFFYSPFPKLVDLVFAGRAAYTQSVGDVPFYVMNQISSTESTYLTALGGLRSLRGYKDSRFVAPNMALGNLELRWTMFDFTVFGQNFAPILVPFFDIGSAFDTPQQISSSPWRYSYGVGLRIAWDQATIIMFDYARSKEDSNLFINFNHIF